MLFPLFLSRPPFFFVDSPSFFFHFFVLEFLLAYAFSKFLSSLVRVRFSASVLICLNSFSLPFGRQFAPPRSVVLQSQASQSHRNISRQCPDGTGNEDSTFYLNCAICISNGPTTLTLQIKS